MKLQQPPEGASSAHAYGTPSVAYRVPGLVASTRHGVTGLLCDAEPRALAEAMLAIHADPDRWAQLSRTAGEDAAKLTPEVTTAAFAAAIEHVIGHSEREERRGTEGDPLTT